MIFKNKTNLINIYPSIHTTLYFVLLYEVLTTLPYKQSRNVGVLQLENNSTNGKSAY